MNLDNLGYDELLELKDKVLEKIEEKSNKGEKFMIIKSQDGRELIKYFPHKDEVQIYGCYERALLEYYPKVYLNDEIIYDPHVRFYQDQDEEAMNYLKPVIDKIFNSLEIGFCDLSNIGLEGEYEA